MFLSWERQKIVLTEVGCAYFSTQIFYILICWCSLNGLFQKKNCTPPHVKNINFFEVNPLNFQSILSMTLPLDFSFYFCIDPPWRSNFLWHKSPGILTTFILPHGIFRWYPQQGGYGFFSKKVQFSNKLQLTYKV